MRRSVYKYLQQYAYHKRQPDKLRNPIWLYFHIFLSTDGLHIFYVLRHQKQNLMHRQYHSHFHPTVLSLLVLQTGHRIVLLNMFRVCTHLPLSWNEVPQDLQFLFAENRPILLPQLPHVAMK